MNLSTSSLPEPLLQSPDNRSRKTAVRVCLVISLAIHAVAMIAVLVASTRHNPGPAVSYIDINSIDDFAPSAAPVIHSPAAQSARVETAPPVPVPEAQTDPAPAEVLTDPVQPHTAEALATSLGRGMASGYFSSIADGRNLRDDIREYYFAVLEKVNNRWWQRAETLKESASRDGIVEFLVSRDGTLLDLRLSKSTGSREVDRAISEVLKDTSPFPPLPDSYGLDTFRAPLKIAAPLHLFSVRRLR